MKSASLQTPACSPTTPSSVVLEARGQSFSAESSLSPASEGSARERRTKKNKYIKSKKTHRNEDELSGKGKGGKNRGRPIGRLFCGLPAERTGGMRRKHGGSPVIPHPKR